MMADADGRSKPAIQRRRTGCFTCRRRRKKCDETKPTCANCCRASIVCEGYPEEAVWSSGRKRQMSMASPARTNTVIEGRQAQAPSAEKDRFVTKQYEPTLHGEGNQSHPMDGGLWTQGNSALWDIFDQDFASLLGQDGDSLQIQIDVPVSLTDTQVGQRFDWSPENALPARQIEDSAGPIPSLSTISIPPLIPGIDSPDQSRLFLHFTNVVSKVLTLSAKPSNPLIEAIVPLALRDCTVMQSLLSFSSSHLSKFANQSRLLELEKRSLYMTARKSTATRLEILDASTFSLNLQEIERLLTILLLLILYELCEGSGDDTWKFYLSNARRLMSRTSSPVNATNSTQELADPSHINPFLLEYFIYHDVLAGVTSTSSPVIYPALSWLGGTTLSLGSSARGWRISRANMVGIDHGLFNIITRISVLRTRTDHRDFHRLGSEIICESLTIWQDLAEWGSAGPNAPSPDSGPADDTEAQTIGSVYQLALFIWLFSVIYPDSILDLKVQKAVAQGLCAMEQIPAKPDSGAMSCLLFPAFVFGSAAVETRDRDDVSTQFEKLKAWSGLGNIALAQDVVHSMWTRYDEGDRDSWDWMTLIERRKISLLIT